MTHDTYRAHEDATHTARVNALLDELTAVTLERDRAITIATDAMDVAHRAIDERDEAHRELTVIRRGPTT